MLPGVVVTKKTNLFFIKSFELIWCRSWEFCLTRVDATIARVELMGVDFLVIDLMGWPTENNVCLKWEGLISCEQSNLCKLYIYINIEYTNRFAQTGKDKGGGGNRRTGWAMKSWTKSTEAYEWRITAERSAFCVWSNAWLVLLANHWCNSIVDHIHSGAHATRYVDVNLI